MQNLAGLPLEKTDSIIRSELTRCGIKIIKSNTNLSHPDVKTHFMGELDNFKFYRNWYYWAVKGEVPLHIAEKLYENVVGQKEIRVAGHCGCPPPHEWATHYTADGRKLINDPDGEQEREWDGLAKKHPEWKELQPEAKAKYCFVKDAAAVADKSVIEAYHIDSELGLYIFVQTLKEHNLVRAQS